MADKHVDAHLAAYQDGELSVADRELFESHIQSCDRCREDLQAVAMATAALRRLPVVPAPPELWAAIEGAAEKRPPWRGLQAAVAALMRPRGGLVTTSHWAVAAAVTAIILGAGWIFLRPPQTTWEVAATAGAPTAGSQRLSGTVTVPTGQIVDTDSQSRARITVGAIGHVQVQPNSSVQLVAAGAKEHRLALHNGEIQASISAPPRLFFVETPAGTAIDLGCEYRLRCDRSGNGMLHVTAGWVAMEWTGRESLVPAGASCRLYPSRGPGVPWFDDAAPAFTQAVENFDREGAGALPALLHEARPRDTLTLWHLLTLVDSAARVQVYGRMAQLAPHPDSVTREQVLGLDSEALRRWREELAWVW